MNEDAYTITQGFLDVGGGHEIYYQTWGNPKGTPIFVLHGGPGGGTSNSQKLLFDPSKHYVVFHDQRGCGKSKPLGKLESNTTQNLSDDIDQLRVHLGIDAPIQLYGTSWGSTLALVYAIQYPHNVSKMLIAGIYTGTKRENDYLTQGGLMNHFPETHEQFLNKVPESKRADVVAYYAEKMSKRTPDGDEHVRLWNINEGVAAIFDADTQTTVQKNTDIDENARIMALIEAYYFKHDCFLTENYIDNNSKKLEHIQIVMVQGRFDHVCPPVTAYRLAQKIGSSCRLHFVPGSHVREMAVRESLRAYAWAFLD